MRGLQVYSLGISPENFGNAQPFAARAASSVLTELTARPSVSMSEALISVPRTIMDLTLEEKIKLLAGKDTWTTHAIDRLKIPSKYHSMAPPGIRGHC